MAAVCDFMGIFAKSDCQNIDIHRTRLERGSKLTCVVSLKLLSARDNVQNGQSTLLFELLPNYCSRDSDLSSNLARSEGSVQRHEWRER
jgi:hypothetical protein